MEVRVGPGCVLVFSAFCISDAASDYPFDAKKTLTTPKNPDYDKNDSVNFCLYLDAPCAPDLVLQVAFDGRQGDKTTQCDKKPQHQAIVFRKLVTCRANLASGMWNHFPTHSVYVDEHTQRITKIEVTIVNERLSKFSGYATYLLQGDVDMHGTFFAKHFPIPGQDMSRFIALPWISAEQSNDVTFMIASKDVPQRTPRWYALRSEDEGPTGSVLHYLLGINVPKKCKKKPWMWNEQVGPERPRPDINTQVIMRNGTLGEDFGTMALLYQHKTIIVHERGIYEIPGRKGWKVSPDGDLFDFSTNERLAFECKTSTSANVLKPEYIPQTYMEMAGLNVERCILERNLMKRAYHPSTKSVAIEDEVAFYNIPRDHKLEEEMFNLAQAAWEVRNLPAKEGSMSSPFQLLVHTPPYVAVRAKIDEIIVNTKAYAEIHVKDHPELLYLFDRYGKYKYALQRPEDIDNNSVALSEKRKRPL